MKSYSARELLDKNLAQKSLLLNLRYVEAFEVAARSAAIFSDETLEADTQLATYVCEDANHLKQLIETFPGGEGWLSDDLIYVLQRVLKSQRPFMAELAHITIVEPTLQTLAQTLASSTSQINDLMERIGREESVHLNLAKILGPSVGKLDRQFAEFIEENGLLLYSTVFPTDEGRTMLLTSLGKIGEGEAELKQIYQRVDDLRAATVVKIFGVGSESVKVVKGYGLARAGMC